MGLLTLGLVLSASVAGMELYIVHTFRPERFEPESHPVWSRWFWKQVHKLGPWIEKSPVNGLIFSLGLSVAIGMVFPAAGVAVMLAGVVSTIATQPVYGARRMIKDVRQHGLLTVIKAIRAK